LTGDAGRGCGDASRALLFYPVLLLIYSIPRPARRTRLRCAKIKNEMASPQWYPTRADVIGIVFAVAVLCACAVAAILGPQLRTNAGFGPDWDCKIAPQSEPICIKKPGH
jgi:hypothetical protein